ncbi:MAG: sulfite reductase [NADPH] flavoprotein alpha-component, partial [Steroidobacteraceae bacterium]|nr:sulfite reductase [NADPH] flavoprotein alpha-component [Steroidobacteraceae bacterium]
MNNLARALAPAPEHPEPPPQNPASTPTGPAVTVLFGSHTGNSERLARRIVERLDARAVPHQLLDMLECRKTHLQETKVLLVVVSTHGDGEPPERALPLSELLNGRKAPRLEHVKFSVLALGDSSYEKFCETGRQFDARLEALGAVRLQPRTECDVDFEAPAERWMDSVIERLEEALGEPRVAGISRPAPSRSTPKPAPAVDVYTRKNPLHAAVLINQRLTAAGSSKDVRHIELSIEGANLHYEPGDALGVVARNPVGSVEALLAALPFDAQAPTDTGGGGTIPLREALIERHDIGPVKAAFLKRYARAIQSPDLAALIDAGGTRLAAHMRERHLLDVIAEHGVARLGPQEFLALLPPLTPRLYSIASSPRATPDEIHLTVGVVEYTALQR